MNLGALLALLWLRQQSRIEEKDIQPLARKRKVAIVKAREAGIPEWIAFKLEP